MHLAPERVDLHSTKASAIFSAIVIVTLRLLVMGIAMLNKSCREENNTVEWIAGVEARKLILRTRLSLQQASEDHFSLVLVWWRPSQPRICHPTKSATILRENQHDTVGSSCYFGAGYQFQEEDRNVSVTAHLNRIHSCCRIKGSKCWTDYSCWSC